MEEIKNKVLTVMSAVFEIDAAEIPADAAPGIVAQWDSLKHMNLIVSLEDEFQVRFSDDEVIDLLNLPKIYSVLEEKLRSHDV